MLPMMHHQLQRNLSFYVLVSVISISCYKWTTEYFMIQRQERRTERSSPSQLSSCQRRNNIHRTMSPRQNRHSLNRTLTKRTVKGLRPTHTLPRKNSSRQRTDTLPEPPRPTRMNGRDLLTIIMTVARTCQPKGAKSERGRKKIKYQSLDL